MSSSMLLGRSQSRALGEPSEVMLSGTVVDDAGRPLAGERLCLLRFTRTERDRAGDRFRTTTDAEGRFARSLPAADAIGLELESRAFCGCHPRLAPGTGAEGLRLVAIARERAPDELVAWIRRQALPLRTADPGGGFEDLRPLAEAIGGARVVALGEPTHGSREVFQLKHRIVEWLVQREGFGVVALEADPERCRAIDTYLRHGRGDARAALAGLGFWTWATEEMHALIEGLRRREVRFAGFDPARTRPGEREAAMAANVHRLLASHPPGARCVVWTHNGHAARGPVEGLRPMGQYLVEALGDGYRAFGFAFDRGSFRALDWTDDGPSPRGLGVHTLGSAPPGHLEEAFARVGLPLCALDLRRRPDAGTVARWLKGPRLRRELGAAFFGEAESSSPAVATELYDTLLYVAETTPTRPLTASPGGLLPCC